MMRDVQVLVVDDHIPNIELLSVILERFNVTVHVATSGYEAKKILETQKIHIALLDVCIPDMSGFEIAKLLRENPENKNAAIIFVTAINITQSDRLTAYELGCIDYIQKPIDLETLDAKISVFIKLAEQELALLKQNETLQTEISNRIKIESKLRRSEETLRLSMASLGQGVWDYDISSGRTYFSQTWLTNICGTNPNTIPNSLEFYKDRIHKDDISLWENEFSSFISGESDTFSQQHRVISPEGTCSNYSDVAMIVSRQPSGKPIRIIGVSTDISEKKKNEDKILLAAAVFEQGAEAAFITDSDARIVSVNKSFSKITGYQESEVLGNTPAMFSSGKHEPNFYKVMWTAINKLGFWSGEIWNRKKNGDIYPEWETITAVRNDNGEIQNYIATFSDMSQKKESEEKIHYLSNYDALTSLPNRILFKELLQSEVSRCIRNNKACALLFIDIDNFKNFNDSLGHDVGDEILLAVSKRLKTVIYGSDYIGRMGGDEFVILLSNMELNKKGVVKTVSSIAMNILQSFNEHIAIRDLEIQLTLSIGTVLYPFDSRDATSLFKLADTALYRAKDLGKNNFVFFSQDLSDDLHKRMELEQDIRKALRNDEFMMYYQPQIDISSGEIIGAEALIRWNHPKKGWIPPVQFIPIAEESGLICDIGSWALSTVCQTLSSWNEKGIFKSPCRIAVNICVEQFCEEGFIPSINAAIQDNAIDAKQLEIELTERALATNLNDVSKKLEQIKSLGIAIAIDDFGTGYSSLNYLKHFPLDILKIDRAFISGLPDDQDDLAITKTIISMAKNLGMKVVAEGVEEREQLLFLQSEQCDMYQGYLYSPAIPANEFEQALITNHLSPA